jgi:phenol 2-monooxygenase
VFILGDACHTHSAKAAQGMNVSIQDGWNLGWKLGHVLEGRSTIDLLSTYDAERREVAQNLIDFDKRWSSLMAAKPGDLEDPSDVERFYVTTAEFAAGFMTEYPPSMIIAQAVHQELAAGFPIGKRFKSAPVVRVCDATPRQLGHEAAADGRWRVYVFDASSPEAVGHLGVLAEWLENSQSSPLALTPADLDRDAWFDLRLVIPRPHAEIETTQLPKVFTPAVGPFGLVNREKIYGVDPEHDIFALRRIDADGVVVVVRPDQYVAAIEPLLAVERLADFFASTFKPAGRRYRAGGS